MTSTAEHILQQVWPGGEAGWGGIWHESVTSLRSERRVRGVGLIQSHLYLVCKGQQLHAVVSLPDLAQM